MDFIAQFKAARIASVPLIAVNTPDPAATIFEIGKLYEDKETPLFVWDVVRGISGYNKVAKDVMASVTDKPEMLRNPVDALVKSLAMPESSILFFFMPSRYLNEPPITQAVWNLRDKFKGESHRTLIMLAPTFSLPSELKNDVLVLDEPLPTTKQLEEIVVNAYKAAEIDRPKKDDIARGVDAVIGLPMFPSEQACFMSASPDGLDFDYLWERKRQVISQTNGLSVWRGGECFADIGGCANAKEFGEGILAGEDKPRAIVFIDEIEKALAGAGGDTSGTSQEMLGTLLSFMQDKNADGMLFIGPPGAAKSALAKAIGNEGGIPTIAFDISGMKGSLVGESGANIRQALKVVEAVSQGRALFIATCNSIGVLPPELRRRFTLGTFFFDLPTAEEREAIWKIYAAKYKIKDQQKPRDEGWTGAEIRQCCKLAWRLRCALVKASTYIVPVCKSAADQIATLRKQADGRFISASKPGFFEVETKETETTTRRKLATV